MTNHKKNVERSISIILISGWVIFLLLNFYPDTSILGKWFALSVWYFFTTIFAMITGILLLTIHVIRSLSMTMHFFYAFTALLNIVFGAIGLVAFFYIPIEPFVMYTAALSLILGLVMVIIERKIARSKK